MESNSKGSSIGLGVRKGSWTAEEDFLLKKCIEKYGAGKWHQVPPRAGLNRCRKSCRLRWLNYLRPNIKRGCFREDEDDLIIRLHKLLGNRWSLIAGRLPERTANDVKNYWNTHLQKRLVMPRKAARVLNSPKIAKPTVIKPRPRAFSNNPPCLKGKSATSIVDNIQFMELNNSKRPLSPPPPPEANDDSTMEWWDKLFVELENNGEGACPLSFNSTEEKVGFNNNMTGEWADKMIIPTHEDENKDEDEDEAGASIFTEYQKGQKSCSTSDFCVDIDVWDLLSCDQDFLN